MLWQVRCHQVISIILPLTQPCRGATGGAGGSISFLTFPFEEKNPKQRFWKGSEEEKQNKHKDRCRVSPGFLSWKHASLKPQDTEFLPAPGDEPVAGEEGGAFHAGINAGSISTAITFQMCDALQTQKVNMAGWMYQ